MINLTKWLLVPATVALSASLLAQSAAPVAPAQGAPARGARAELKWPAGYIEPNTPGMKYVTPETPQGTGPYKAIMAADPGAKEFVLYYPANLDALGTRKMPIVLWGNGSCTYQGNKFRNFLTEISSHGYLSIAGGPMGPPSGETITMASNNWTPSAIGPKPPARVTNPAQARVTVDLLSKGIDWAIAENSRRESKFYGKLDTTAVAVMGQSCGAGLAASFGGDKRVKTLAPGAAATRHCGTRSRSRLSTSLVRKSTTWRTGARSVISRRSPRRLCSTRGAPA